MNRVVSGEIYTAGKNFTLPPAVTALTNFTSGAVYYQSITCSWGEGALMIVIDWRNNLKAMRLIHINSIANYLLVVYI